MYEVLIPDTVQRQLDRIPKKKSEQILKRILTLGDNPWPRGTKKTKGVANTFHIWIGRSYRVVYEVERKEQCVVILDVAHKQSVRYRR